MAITSHFFVLYCFVLNIKKNITFAKSVFMKKIVLIILLTQINILSIWAKSDTLLIHSNYRGMEDAVEYYLYSKNKVSSLSCFLLFNNNDLESISCSIDVVNGRKKVVLPSLNRISENELLPSGSKEKHCYKMSYEHQIRMLDRVIKDAYKNFSFKINNELSLSLFLHQWGDESIRISKKWKDLRKDEFDYETLKTVIKQSHLYKDVSDLLSDYSIEISEVSIEPDVHFIFPNDSMKYNIVTQDVNDIIISAKVFFTCVQKIK